MRRGWLVAAMALVVLGAAVWMGGTAGARPRHHRVARAATFRVGAAIESFTPAPAGAAKGDPANCLSASDLAFNGPRAFAFEEPYIDAQHDGHYDPGDPFIDCNHDGRWDGNYLGGGGSNPRYYDRVADPVGARAVVITSGRRTIAMEVVDQEGLFNVYADRIRAKVAADGYRLASIQISASHDESAPDSLGLGGPTPAMSGTNAYFVDYLVNRSALAIERAYANRRPARIRYAQAQEPANLRQCWSSYPYIDNPLIPVMQAVTRGGSVIATLASVSQHTESLGFNTGTQGDPGARPSATLDQENRWISADWPYWFRTSLQAAFGGVGIEMAGSVGSVETPQVFRRPSGAAAALSRRPQRFIDASHPAGCATLFAAPRGAGPAPLGYYSETKALGQDLAGGVKRALRRHASWSKTSTIWASTVSICVPVANALFKAAALGGVFAERPAYLPGCQTKEVNPAPTGQTAGTSIKSDVAAWRIGDAEFLGAPGEVFPFTFFRGPVGPQDMNYPQYALPPWPLPYMHTPWRFFDGLDDDMIGYIFPRGNAAGIPGQNTTSNPTASNVDRFGCVHSDDAEAVNAQAADTIGAALVSILKSRASRPESVARGRFVLRSGRLSRNPLSPTDTIKCSGASTSFAAAPHAVAVWEPRRKLIRPAHWMDLFGRPQRVPDRDTRGWIDRRGHRHWLNVWPDIAAAPARVKLR